MRATILTLLLLLLPWDAHSQLVADIVHEQIGLEIPTTTVSGKRAEWKTISTTPTLGYTGVAFQGFSTGDNLEAQVRFQLDDGWSEWLDAHLVESATDNAFAGGVRDEAAVFTGRFELRLTADSGGELELLYAGTFDNRRDEDRLPGKSQSVQHSINAAKTHDPPPLITRSEWNADPFIRGNPVPLAQPNYQYMTFHHAAGFSGTTLQEGLAQVKAIQDLHQNVRGWSDIGYQFVIDRAGRLYQGRPFMDGSTSLQQLPVLARGAHVGEQNTGNIGVCLLGCYHPPEGANCQDVMPEVSFNTYARLFAFFSEVYLVAPEQIRGHRDFSSTACPGDNNYSRLPQLIQEVNTILLIGGDIPENYSLEPVFPNPFSEQATINYYVEDDGIVKLRIFDTKGSLVAELVDEFQSGPRLRSVDFRPSNLPSGVYYASITVEGFSGVVFESTQKLVYIR